MLRAFSFYGLHMESITSESSTPASVEAPSATPAPAAESTPAADAIQQVGVTPDQPAQQPVQSDETVVGSQDDEFPDDAAFQALPGEQRASNWAKARARIGEQNRRIEELSTLESFKPVAESIERLGGWDSVEPLLELATKLYSPAIGEDGEPLIDPQTGLQRYTAGPFVEQLAEQSLDTVGEIMMRAFDVKVGKETLGHWFMRKRLGLDPGMVSLYQQIQSPEQAREHITRSGGIDPTLFEDVTPEYHDALRSLLQTRPGLSQQWEQMDDQAKVELLEDRRELLENRKYAEEQRRRDEQTSQERQAEAKRRIEETGRQGMAEAEKRVVDAQLAKLKQTATFFADEADNAEVWDDIVRRSAQDLFAVPELAKKSRECEAWYTKLAEYDATGDKLKASQARVEIGKIERKLEKEFADRVTARTGQWSRRLGGARAVQQQQITEAKPRIEIGAPGDTTGGNPAPAPAPAPPGMRFGFSEEWKQQRARELAQRRQATGGG